MGTAGNHDRGQQPPPRVGGRGEREQQTGEQRLGGTSAVAIAVRISSVGLVLVSEKKSMSACGTGSEAKW